MIVCHCHGVNDRTIEAAALAGATELGEIEQVCGAGGDCGGCVEVVEEILDGVRYRAQAVRLTMAS